MAISNLTATTTNSGAGTASTLTANKPTSTTTNTVLIADVGVGGTTVVITPPAGWTALGPQNTRSTFAQQVYYKVCGGSEPSTYGFGISSSTNTGSLVISGYTGVDPNNPIAGFAQTNAATTTTPAFPATIPQAETVYGVLCSVGKNVTGSSTLSTPSSGYSVNGDTCTSVSFFMEAYIQDQHTTYGLPLATVTPGSATVSVTSQYCNTVVFLRPSIAGTTTLVTDVATFAETLSSPETTLAFGTGYANEYVYLFISENSASNSETCTVTGTTLTWTLLKRANSGSVITGSSEVWYAPAATALAFNSETITITPSTAGSTLNASVYSFINSAGPGAATASEVASGTPSLAVTTTSQNSWIWATLMDVTNNTAPTVGANQTLVQDDLLTGEGMWVWRQTNAAQALGTSVTMSATAPTGINYSMVVAEILGFNAAVSDSTSTSESVTTLTNSFIQTSDSTTTSENVSILIPTLNIAVSDSTTTSEAITMLSTDSIAVNDTEGTSENIKMLSIANVTVNDTEGTSEALTMLAVDFVTVNDATTTSENVTVTIAAAGGLTINVSDSEATSETVTPLIPFLLISVSDTTSTSESITVQISTSINVNDTTTTSENVSVVITSGSPPLSVSATDTLTTSEAVSLALAYGFPQNLDLALSLPAPILITMSVPNPISINLVIPAALPLSLTVPGPINLTVS